MNESTKDIIQKFNDNLDRNIASINNNIALIKEMKDDLNAISAKCDSYLKGQVKDD